MSIQDFLDYLKRIGIKLPMYPLAFPASSPKKSMIVETGQGFAGRGSVFEVTLTITVRAKHPSESEALAKEINELLADRTDELIGESGQIILIKSQQLIPNWMGKDAEGNHYYMVNFKVLVDN